jgi:hypothetical protein
MFVGSGKGGARNISRARACRVRRSLPSLARGVYRRVSSWYKCAEEIPQDASRLTLREPSRESVPQENTPVSPVSDIRCVYRLRSNPRGHVEDKLIPSDALNDDVALEIMKAVRAFMRMLAAELPETI